MASAVRAEPASLGYGPLLPVVAAYTAVVTTIGFLAPLLLEMAYELGVAPAEIGQLVVVTALPWALLAPCCGLISDRLGRRPVILVSLVGMGLATLLGALATDLRLLVLARLLAGSFGSGGPPTMMAGLVEHYPPHQRGRIIGWLNASFSLAALGGVPLAGAVGGIWGWRASFLLVGCSLLLAALLVGRSYPRLDPGVVVGGNPLRAYRYLLGRPHLPTLLISNLGERITYMILMLYLPSLLISSYGLDPVSIAPALVVTALGALSGVLLGGQLADRWNRAWLASASLALSGLCALTAFLWPLHLAFTIAAGFGFGLLNGAGRPAFIALLLGLVDQHRGAANGLFALSNQFGWALGAGLGGYFLSQAGYPGLAQFGLVASIAAAGLTLLARSASPPPGSAPATQSRVRSASQG